MTLRIRAATALILGIASGAASAEQRVGDWYIGPTIGHAQLDNDRDAKDDSFLGATIGRHFSELVSAEFNFTRGTYDQHSGGGELGLNTYTLDALHIFARESAISPYISVGAGMMRNKLDNNEADHHLLGQVGLGLWIDGSLRKDGSVRAYLRPEIKARWELPQGNVPQDHFLDYTAGLGFYIAFGAPRPVETPPPAPAPAPVAAPPPPPPPPPADTDGDGVTDDIDKCPDTPRGVAVDAYGCPRRGTATLEGVTFEFNSATLTGDSQPVLHEVATDLKAHPRLKIELQGHTDSVGADKYNLNLSQKRAQSVREYLIAQGVGEQQLTAKGYGESEPIADNKTEEGRAKNRRVVMMVLENPGEVKIDMKEPKN